MVSREDIKLRGNALFLHNAKYGSVMDSTFTYLSTAPTSPTITVLSSANVDDDQDLPILDQHNSSGSDDDNSTSSSLKQT